MKDLNKIENGLIQNTHFLLQNTGIQSGIILEKLE